MLHVAMQKCDQPQPFVFAFGGDVSAADASPAASGGGAFQFDAGASAFAFDIGCGGSDDSDADDDDADDSDSDDDDAGKNAGAASADADACDSIKTDPAPTNAFSFGDTSGAFSFGGDSSSSSSSSGGGSSRQQAARCGITWQAACGGRSTGAPAETSTPHTSSAAGSHCARLLRRFRPLEAGARRNRERKVFTGGGAQTYT